MPKVSDEYFDQKKEEIINAAYKVALTKSIRNITLKDVRDEVGMARGGIYRYYNNLDEILAALIVKVNSDNSYTEDIKKILSKGKASKPSNVLKKLCNLFVEYITSRSSDALIIGIQFEVFCIHEPERVKKILSIIDGSNENSNNYLFAALTDYINAETKKGTMKPVMPIPMLMEYFFTVYKGILFQYSISQNMTDEEPYDIASIYKAFYHTLTALLGCAD